MPVKSDTIYRFGLFDFDARTGELRKGGVKLKLQEQPSQILLKLLQSSGDLVSREELRSALWRQDTFVDFENGLNTAIKRLRETLGDSADNPTFIETIPRKGYRFIAESKLRSDQEHLTEPVGGHATPRHHQHQRRAWLIGAAALLAATGILIWHERPRLPTVTNAVRLSNDRQSKIPMNLPVTDGVHLYFVEGTPWTSGSRIAQMAAVGGETTGISTALPNVLAIYGISPDGSELLVANGVATGPDPVTGRSGGAAELWVQPLPGGTPHRVGNLYASAACWTPDARHLLYANGRGILLANKEGAEPKLLAKPPDVVRSLRYSPDGRLIRFQVNLPPGFADSITLWEMDADGKNLHQLFSGWKESPFQCCGNWSADGSYYYFQAGRGSDQSIWVKPERRFLFGGAKRRPVQLISGPLRFSAPVPSADGKKLFVVGREVRVELLRYDARAKRFDSYLHGISAGPFDFSPDRQWIAYVSYPEMDLWRSRADGSEKMQLTFPPVRAYAPRWSPDGMAIAFTDVAYSHAPKVRLVPASGGNAELLSPAGDEEGQTDPTWMPDGRSIVFAVSKGFDSSGIYRLSLDTHERELVASSQGLFSPRVSPDGRYISAFAGDSTKLMLFDTTNNRWRTLAAGKLFGSNQWSHDGKYVYVRESPGNGYSTEPPFVSRVRVSDGRSEHVVTLKDFPQIVDIYATGLGLTLDDSPVLMRDRSVQEIYALDLDFH